MIDPSELSRWESAVANLFAITNDNIGCPKPDSRICIRGLPDDQRDPTVYFELVEKACLAGIDSIPFCRQYNVSTLQIFLNGYLMLRGNSQSQDTSLLFLEVVEYIHYNKPHTWDGDEEDESYYRFLMYVLMVGCMHDDQIVLNWFRSNCVNLCIGRMIYPSKIPILLKFLEIDEFYLYITDSFDKLIVFISKFSVTVQGQQQVLQYAQKMNSSRRVDIVSAGLGI